MQLLLVFTVFAAILIWHDAAAPPSLRQTIQTKGGVADCPPSSVLTFTRLNGPAGA